MALALFDLDRTLITVNSGKLWVKSELRGGRLSRWQATRAAMWIFGYHLGYTKMEAVLADAIATLTDQDEEAVRTRTHAFYAAEVQATYRARARAVVESHRARGHTLALLTSSSNYLAEPVMADLGIPHALCNRFEVVDGRFTGKPSGALCFGEGKLTHARALAESLGEKLEDAWFYTDSASDVSVMEVVGHPVAVHPDPRLRRIATSRGWRIEDWDEVEASGPPG